MRYCKECINVTYFGTLGKMNEVAKYKTYCSPCRDKIEHEKYIKRNGLDKPRFCKVCGVKVGKGKSACEDCKRIKRRKRNDEYNKTENGIANREKWRIKLRKEYRVGGKYYIPPAQRYCKDCGVKVGQSKHFCEDCLLPRLRIAKAKAQRKYRKDPKNRLTSEK